MDTKARAFVRQRAGDRCEYCLLHQQHSELRHHVEHIVPRKHKGLDDPDNLALACHRCNLYKGTNLSGIDPHTAAKVSLFHPRHDRWAEHFKFKGIRIEGTSPTGRATVQVLAMNDARRLELRQELLLNGELR
jgi:hypothetical protein